MQHTAMTGLATNLFLRSAFFARAYQITDFYFGKQRPISPSCVDKKYQKRCQDIAVRLKFFILAF